MFLFVSIVLLCLLFLVMADLIKLIKIPSYIKQRSVKYIDELQQQLDVATQEMNVVKEMKFKDAYGYHVQVLRAEEKVIELQKKLKKETNIQALKSASAEVVATYCAKGLISLILFIISIRNRYTPVAVLDESLNLQPLTGIFSFPTGVSNAISVPMWVLSCNVTFNFINNLIRKKL